MIISSRTPEGAPNRCPVCANEVSIEPSVPLGASACGDAPCPNCGTLLWFISDNIESRLYPADEMESLASPIAETISKILGVGVEDVAGVKSFANDLGTDSLDTVELVMELEEEFGIVVSDDEAERLTTVPDAIEFLKAHRHTP